MLTSSVADMIISESFLTFGVAFLATAIGVLAKIGSRNVKNKGKSLNELNVGPDLMVTAMILLVTKSIDRLTDLNRPGVDEVVRQGLNAEMALCLWTLLWFVVGAFLYFRLCQFVGMEKQK